MPTRVHFATNREEIVAADGTVTGFGPRLNPKSPLWLRYGVADMEPDRKGENPYRIARLDVAPENIPNTPEATGDTVLLGSDAVFAALRERLVRNDADLVMMLHGYACDFANALSNAAEIKEAYATRSFPIETAIFSWPADGRIVPFLSYASDRDDARSSAKAIARALQRLLAHLAGIQARAQEQIRRGERPDPPLCRAKIHLVAHSMGNYALRNALQALISDYGGRKLPRVLDTIFLMAADEDNDAFEHDTKLARLPELAERVYVYFARNDRALVISDVSKGNPDRLGATGPRTLTSLPQKVTLVDCTDVSETGAGVKERLADANHQYYRKRAEVIADVRQVLAGKAPEAVSGREWIPARTCFRIKAAKR
jgi:esterase/lipase superfamily enzyme